MRVTESMGPAWETMKRMLFRPFNIGTWFSFGFIFFLQSCIEGGGGGGNNLRLPNTSGAGGHGGGGGSHGGTSNDLAGLFHDLVGSGSGDLPDTGLIVIIAVVACVVAIPIVILALWLGTRGQMMAIRTVASGQASIGDQWNATRDAGSKLFKFHLAMSGIGFLFTLPLAGGGVLLAMPVIRDGAPIESILPALIGLGVVLVLLMIPFFLVNAMARNFVAPIMLKHGIGAREGWVRFWAVGKQHVGGIFLFYVMRVLVGIGAAVVGVLAGLLTCCLGFLPVLNQTLMAPYHVFERAWTLEVLASMSPDFDLRGSGGAPPPPMPYNQGGYNPYAGQPGDNPYAPPGYGGGGPAGGGGYGPAGGGGYGGGGYGPPPGGGFGSPPGGGFGSPT
jgi:uncharacterized membrane protein YgcG